MSEQPNPELPDMYIGAVKVGVPFCRKTLRPRSLSQLIWSEIIPLLSGMNSALTIGRGVVLQQRGFDVSYKFTLLAGASTVVLGFSSYLMPAYAGNIVLTGHDNDYHCDAGNAGGACGVLDSEINFVRDGSSLPVLVIDDGSQLTGSLSGTITGSTAVPYVAVSVGSVTAGMFNHTKYSAIAVASVTSCGGCDNPVGTGTQLAAFTSAIASFFNAGGGILGLAGATDADAYAYVPDSAGSPTPIYSSSGFVATTTGTSGIAGFAAVNGDQTHNTFANPGTGGVSSVYKVAERFGGTTGLDPAVTLFAKGLINCTGSSCTLSSTTSTTTPPTSVPEPMTLSLLGVGVFGLAAARRKQRLLSDRA